MPKGRCGAFSTDLRQCRPCSVPNSTREIASTAGAEGGPDICCKPAADDIGTRRHKFTPVVAVLNYMRRRTYEP